ncbi:MAG: glycine--tRNA ligase subunit beta [Leptospirales bacterium]
MNQSEHSLFPGFNENPDQTAFLEIGCEELPSAPLPALRSAIASKTNELRSEYRLGKGKVHVLGTPQRIVLVLESLPSVQEPFQETVLGPPAKLAGSLPDAPSPQAMGFAKSQGVSISEVRIVESPKGSYLAIDKTAPQRKTEEVLPELFARTLEGLPLPKTMRWGAGSGPFLRPILWVLAYWGNRLLSLPLGGLMSGSTTRNPRSAGFIPHPVRGVSHYVVLIQSWGIQLEPEERGNAIERELDLTLKIEQDVGRLDPSVHRVADPVLSTEVLDLVECFRVVVGHFAESYLTLPPELIQTVLRVHQRFYVLAGENGTLSNCFLAVSGNPAADLEIVRTGYEKVIRARLEDAQYYLDRDRKRPLLDFVEDLGGMTFFPGVGTLADKVSMFRVMVQWVLNRIPESEVEQTGFDRATLSDSLDRIARLAKADLATGLVREFPELEGRIGAHYWKLEHEGIREREGQVPSRLLHLESEAIAEHYHPRHVQDRLPVTLPGLVLSLVDKLLHQVGGFAAGFVPSGSEDPYALRRSAWGMLAILRKTAWPITLEQLVSEVGNLSLPRDVSGELRKFWGERLQGFWEKEYPVLLVRAGATSLSETLEISGSRLRFLSEISGRAGYAGLLSLYTRLVNILPDATEINKGSLDPSRLEAPSEKSIHALMLEEGMLDADLWMKKAVNGDWERILNSVLGFVDPVQRMFEEVMVNDPDPVLRTNRKTLLSRLRSSIGVLGHLDLLPVPSREGR